jgi:hypothetical protein
LTIQSNFQLNAISQAVEQLKAISLEAMDKVKLMNRIDKKYIVPTSSLIELIKSVSQDYSILVINGSRICNYDTLYYDTPNFDLYHAHQNGRANRYKVRHRKYLETEVAFFEVKHKSNKKRTDKKRKPSDARDESNLQEDNAAYLQSLSNLDASRLIGNVKIYYKRLTLVSKTAVERLTIDLILTYEYNDKIVSYPEIAIVEVKQDQKGNSKFEEQLKILKFKPGGISKYCWGIISTIPEVKQNRFKSKLRKINKLIQANDSFTSSDRLKPI